MSISQHESLLNITQGLHNDFAHKLSLSLWHEERVSSFLDMLGMCREVCSPAKHQETIKNSVTTSFDLCVWLC